MAHILPDGHPVGWQCPVCRRVWAPSVTMCGPCLPRPEMGGGFAPGCSCGTTVPCSFHDPALRALQARLAGTSADVVDFIAKGHLGTPCPKPREGGLCGCDEDEPEPPAVCLSSECDC